MLYLIRNRAVPCARGCPYDRLRRRCCAVANPDMGTGGRGGSGNGAGLVSERYGHAHGQPGGNGRRDRGEQCDDGNLESGDGCDEMCRVEMLCGNEKSMMVKSATSRP